METTENPPRTYRVRTTDWHVQVTHRVHGGHDRGRPLDAVHIEWTRQVPEGHPDRPAAIAAAEGIARILNEHLPLAPLERRPPPAARDNEAVPA